MRFSQKKINNAIFFFTSDELLVNKNMMLMIGLEENK